MASLFGKAGRYSFPVSADLDCKQYGAFVAAELDYRKLVALVVADLDCRQPWIVGAAYLDCRWPRLVAAADFGCRRPQLVASADFGCRQLEKSEAADFDYRQLAASVVVDVYWGTEEQVVAATSAVVDKAPVVNTETELDAEPYAEMAVAEMAVGSADAQGCWLEGILSDQRLLEEDPQAREAQLQLVSHTGSHLYQDSSSTALSHQLVLSMVETYLLHHLRLVDADRALADLGGVPSTSGLLRRRPAPSKSGQEPLEETVAVGKEGKEAAAADFDKERGGAWRAVDAAAAREQYARGGGRRSGQRRRGGGGATRGVRQAAVGWGIR
ncbi:hypothetical protein ABZP36_009451 [Zizania latifolia]